MVTNGLRTAMYLFLLAAPLCGTTAQPDPVSNPAPNAETEPKAAAHSPAPKGAGSVVQAVNHAPVSLRLQQQIVDVFEKTLPALKAVQSDDSSAYRAILASQTPAQQAELLTKLAGPISELNAFYGGSPWAFTAHVLNLPANKDPVADARSRAINDYICAGDEVSTCQTGAPSIETAYGWMRTLVDGSHGRARLVTIGYSREGRPLQAIEIGRPGSRKPTLWFDGVIHGNEPMGFEVVKDIATYLLSSDAQAAKWRKRFDFVLLPVINPDGYALSNERIGWRKNARRAPDGRIVGIDLNRAFPTADPYRSPDSDPYAKEWMPSDGAQEPEVLAFMAYAALIKPIGALDFHSNAHFIAAPNIEDQVAKACFQNIANGLRQVIHDERGFANTYRAGSANDLFNQPDGTPGSVKSTNIQWLWEKFGTTALSIELLDQDSSQTWPNETVRDLALKGVRPAWKKFIQLMSVKKPTNGELSKCSAN
ncbi:hypothetical protein FHS52_001178 [Erythromicrobium ramosum]|uniref:Peptidase M14 domain-containing protein n=1 Tax=Erythrobacter ramosus TaxID=35811 RepID=A0A6I4UD72_9SPHN|nr:M14 family metallopeptidase [Erythrobacter ramosus]MBB3775235.1 hypothetical protein [Erythrobacter ramosus]MXP37141.1 hypothetical protein [Erythrobacter ramosus]